MERNKQGVEDKDWVISFLWLISIKQYFMALCQERMLGVVFEVSSSLFLFFRSARIAKNNG